MILVRRVSKGQYKAKQGSIDGFIFATAYALVTGGVFSIQRIKPPIAFLLAFGYGLKFEVRYIPTASTKLIY